jgi:hypothetical protein
MNSQLREAAATRLVVTPAAREQVACALREVVLESIRFGPRDLPRAEDWDWLLGAVAVPLQHATDAALDRLSRDLADALDRVPVDLLARIERSRAGEDLGWE